MTIDISHVWQPSSGGSADATTLLRSGIALLIDASQYSVSDYLSVSPSVWLAPISN